MFRGIFEETKNVFAGDDAGLVAKYFRNAYFESCGMLSLAIVSCC